MVLIRNRLFNYGVGIHLIKSEDPDNMPKISHINPKDNHISFQVCDLSLSLSLLCLSVSLFISVPVSVSLFICTKSAFVGSVRAWQLWRKS
jgi:hypothetical protein